MPPSLYPVMLCSAAPSYVGFRPLRLIRVVCVLALAGALLGAEDGKRSFDLPAGPAEKSLRQFSAQSGLPVMFPTEITRGLQTPAVQGRFAAREALDRLLVGTGLIAIQDEKSGAFTVRKSTPPPRPMVAAEPVEPAPPPAGAGAIGSTASKPPKNPRTLASVLTGWFALTAPSEAQTATNLPTSDDGTVTLSPFEVRTDKDTGYTATSTLAGSRLNTALRDTPASISVFTKEFLDDIGAINVTEALQYSLNGSIDLTDQTGNVVTSTDLPLQFRGFNGASLGRNYFSWSLSSDSYNIERLDFARGPNSILFGIGGPGGILNTTTKRARIGKTTDTVGVRIASWDDYRGTIDLERTLLAGKLAARVNLLAQDRKGWREFDSMQRLAGALAFTYRPFQHTEIRIDSEYGDVAQVTAQPWPAQERFQGWIDAGRAMSTTFGAVAAGTAANTVRTYVYDPLSGLGPISWFNSRITNPGVTSPALGNNTVAITDPAILPRNATLSGPGFTSNFYYYNYGVFIEQRLGSLSLEAAANRQTEQRDTARPQVFNDVALRLDPNAQLPNGQPNPNAGKYYTDGVLTTAITDAVRDDLRFTASYDLDLRKPHRWLGQHTFASLWSRREDRGHGDAFTEVNLTPTGANFAPGTPAATYLDLTNNTNFIRRRTTIDFSSGDPAKRGFQDPAKNPIVNLNGVTSGLARVTDGSANNVTRTDSAMLAYQGRFLADRLVLTGGFRNDRQRAWGSTADLNGNGNLADDRDPVTRTFPKRIRLSTANYLEGDTRTYGAVVHVNQNVSLFYNNANNFTPQSNLDIFGNPLGNRHGEGEDMGVRVSVLDGRISGTIARYRTDETNRSVTRDGAFINDINVIWSTLNQVEKQVLASSTDGQDTVGKGWEYDFTANPTPNWRLAVNFARTEQTVGRLMPHYGAYVEVNRVYWKQNGTTRLVAGAAGVPTVDPNVGGPATINTAIDAIDALYSGFKQAEGQSRRQLRKYTGNVFSSYRIPLQFQRLNGLTVGAGVNYRGDEVIGYDSSRNNAPLYGGAYTLVNAMLATQLRLHGRQNLRLQLNVDNLLREDKLIVTDADQTRAYRYVFQTPRRWSLSSTLSF